MFLRPACLILLVAAASLTAHAPAFADGPRIVADCAAPKPAPGATFSGPVLQVLDGSRLCVALSPDPKDWIEVEPVGLTPVSTAEGDGRTLLMASTFSRRVECVAADPRDDAVAAVCTVEGLALGDAMRAAQAKPDWKAWH